LHLVKMQSVCIYKSAESLHMPCTFAYSNDMYALHDSAYRVRCLHFLCPAGPPCFAGSCHGHNGFKPMHALQEISIIHTQGHAHTNSARSSCLLPRISMSGMSNKYSVELFVPASASLHRKFCGRSYTAIDDHDNPVTQDGYTSIVTELSAQALDFTQILG